MNDHRSADAGKVIVTPIPTARSKATAASLRKTGMGVTVGMLALRIQLGGEY